MKREKSKVIAKAKDYYVNLLTMTLTLKAIETMSTIEDGADALQAAVAEFNDQKVRGLLKNFNFSKNHLKIS